MTTSWPISGLPRKGFANVCGVPATPMTLPHERLSHAAATQARPRSRYAPCDPGRCIEIASRTWCSGAVASPRCSARSAGYPRVLPALRLEGSAGCDGLPGDGARRGARLSSGMAAAATRSRGGGLDRRTAGPGIQRDIRSDLRRMSLEAQSQMFAAPELIQPAYAEMLEPLIEQLSAVWTGRVPRHRPDE